MSMQVIVGFDVSASMKGAHNGSTRIQVAKELVGQIVSKVVTEDPDGVDLYTFGQNVTYLGQKDLAGAQAALSKLQASEYATNTGEFLAQAFTKANGYIKNGDQALIVCITDGEASDQAKVESTIIGQTQKMNADGELAIEFVTVGHDADAWMKHLDDGLTKAKFDVVDQTSIEDVVNMGMEDFFNKAFND